MKIKKAVSKNPQKLIIIQKQMSKSNLQTKSQTKYFLTIMVLLHWHSEIERKEGTILLCFSFRILGGNFFLPQMMFDYVLVLVLVNSSGFP